MEKIIIFFSALCQGFLKLAIDLPEIRLENPGAEDEKKSGDLNGLDKSY